MRLKRFEDIIGHGAAIARLKRDIAGQRLPHTYLFVGPEGVGKAAVAALMGMAMLCRDESPEKRPCGVCRACEKAQRSNHPDFHVLTTEKGKRQIRIDQVRALQADLALKPYEADWKVALVDKAEALNEAAQNSLLKTLEEPPGNALLLLVAPSAQSLLPTIVSRARIERFGPLKREELAALLVSEKGMDRDEAILVAGLAGGSVGMAMDMDMNFVREDRIKLLKAIGDAVTGNSAGGETVLGVADSMSSAGEEGLSIIRSWLRDVAMLKLGQKDPVHSDLAPNLEVLAAMWGMDAVMERFDATTRAQEGFRKNLNKSLIFETLALALIRGIRRTSAQA